MTDWGSPLQADAWLVGLDRDPSHLEAFYTAHANTRALGAHFACLLEYSLASSSTPRVPLEFPSSTPRVPLEYPRVPLAYLGAHFAWLLEYSLAAALNRVSPKPPKPA